MRDPPLCHERFRVCAAPAARHSAFHHQNLFLPIPPAVQSDIKGGSIHGSQNEHPRTEFAVYKGLL